MIETKNKLQTHMLKLGFFFSYRSAVPLCFCSVFLFALFFFLFCCFFYFVGLLFFLTLYVLLLVLSLFSIFTSKLHSVLFTSYFSGFLFYVSLFAT